MDVSLLAGCSAVGSDGRGMMGGLGSFFEVGESRRRLFVGPRGRVSRYCRASGSGGAV